MLLYNCFYILHIIVIKCSNKNSEIFEQNCCHIRSPRLPSVNSTEQNQLSNRIHSIYILQRQGEDNFWARDTLIKHRVTIPRMSARVQLNGLRSYRQHRNNGKEERKERRIYIYANAIWVQNPSRENVPSLNSRRGLSPAYRFSPAKWPANRKREFVDHSRPSSRDRAATIGGSRATRGWPGVAISQIDPGHERNLFLSSPCDPRSSPSPSLFSHLSFSFSLLSHLFSSPRN